MTDSEKIKLINIQNLFQHLSSNELLLMTEILQEQVLPLGEIFIEQDQPSDKAYLICDGSARVYRYGENGEEINIAIIGPGEIVGELSLIDDAPTSAYVQTLQQTKVLVLSRTNFHQILKKNPEMAINLLKVLSKRVRDANQHLEDIVSKNLAERTWKMLQALAEYFPNKEISLSQEELAGIIGATRARVTEVLNTLKNQGKIILSHRKIHIS